MMDRRCASFGTLKLMVVSGMAARGLEESVQRGFVPGEARIAEGGGVSRSLHAAGAAASELREMRTDAALAGLGAVAAGAALAEHSLPFVRLLRPGSGDDEAGDGQGEAKGTHVTPRGGAGGRRRRRR
jgi:hypothetical protein